MVDASWVQYFRPSDTQETPNAENGAKTSDFGTVLQDLISVQGSSTNMVARPNGANFIHPAKFFRDFVKCNLNDLERRFKWGDAKVDLIATIPGEYEGRLGGRMDEYRKQGE